MSSSIEKYIHNQVEKSHPFFSTSADFYLKWLPYVTVFVLDILGVKTRSGWKKQVLIAASADSIRYLITDNLKKFTHEHRPAPYMGNHSFPSGHTSSSFAGAQFMQKELKDSIPFITHAGYLGATATGIIRIYKGKHWLKDVVAGAAIGILSAKMAYYLVNKLWRKKRKNLKTEPNAAEKKMQLELP